MSMTTLNCLVSGDGADKIFQIQISADASVDTLKGLVKAEDPLTFANVGAKDMQLVKVSLPLDELDKVRDPLSIVNSQALSSPLDEISEVFPDPQKRHVHVIALRPTAKRPRSPSASFSELEQRKRNKLAVMGPSTIAKCENYEMMQRYSPENILDDRPQPDHHMPPISLLYNGFGLFLDIVDGRNDVDGLSDVDVFKIVKEVDRFADMMCKFYSCEGSRRDAALDCLNKIFGARKNPIPESCLSPACIGSVWTNGHCDGLHHVAFKIAEIKNRMTGISLLPDAELVSYFVHSQKSAIEKFDEKLFRGWRIPCLGIVIIGCEVRFYAMLTLGPKFRLVSLTPLISCIKAASDGRERKALHTAFIAASVLQARIYTDINEHLFSRSPTIHHDTTPPYLPAITKIGSVEIWDLEAWHQSQPYRYLYHAKDQHGTAILVKFSQQYSSELHEFCARKGLAPALRAYERLSGGWYGVAMEYLPDIEPISLSLHLEQYREDWKSQLEELVGSFHERGLVHGDLRDANIVCDARGRMWLIDFDWGGEEGKVFYPTPNLHQDLLHGRTSETLAITKEDDLRVLKITLERVDQIVEASAK